MAAVELTADGQLRFDAEPASIEDVDVLAAWLAERGVEPLFRADGGQLRIAGLRDLPDVSPAAEPTGSPRWLLEVLVADGRTADGWRETGDRIMLNALEDWLDAYRGRPVRFEPVRADD